MSRIRRNIEYYRLPSVVETEGLSGSGSENEFNIYENTNAAQAGVAIDGYQKFTNGLMMVWGRTPAFANSLTIGNFSTVTCTFSHAFIVTYNVSLTLVSDGSATDHVETPFGIQTITTTNCSIEYGRSSGTADGANMRFHYQAFGTWV